MERATRVLQTTALWQIVWRYRADMLEFMTGNGASVRQRHRRAFGCPSPTLAVARSGNIIGAETLLPSLSLWFAEECVEVCWPTAFARFDVRTRIGKSDCLQLQE